MKKRGFVLLLFALLPALHLAAQYDEGGYRYRIVYRYPTYSFIRTSLFGIFMTSGYDFYNLTFNYDHFDGKKAMYHLTLGYIPRDYNYSVDAAGFTAGFTYGKILSGSHWRDSAGTISLDFGGMVNYAKIDDQSEGWYGHIKGKYQNFEGHFGPRFDLFLKLLPNNRILDCWLSTWFHLVGGARKWDCYEDGSLEGSGSDAGIGFAWGMVMAGALINIELEAGFFIEGFLRAGIGLAFGI
jgi:hypothetical protein